MGHGMGRKLFSLVMITSGRKVLLGFKKRGFGVGKWNGFGGKVEAGESIEESAHRELKEECGLQCQKLDKVGILEFQFVDNPVVLMEVHVFHSDCFSGDVTETEEMRPQWFEKSEAPYDCMWLDDYFWWNYFLTGYKFQAYFVYQGFDKIIHYKIKTKTSLPSGPLPNPSEI